MYFTEEFLRRIEDVLYVTCQSSYPGSTNNRSSLQEVFCKKGALKNFAKLTGKHLCQSLFFKKETLTQVFSCESCENFKGTFFYRTPPVAASEINYCNEYHSNVYFSLKTFTLLWLSSVAK